MYAYVIRFRLGGRIAAWSPDLRVRMAYRRACSASARSGKVLMSKIETVQSAPLAPVETLEQKIARLESQLAAEQAKPRLKPQELSQEQGRLRAKGEMPLGSNIEHKLDGTVLTIRMDLSKTHGKTKSGDSWSIASTNGNIAFGTDGTRIGINVFRSTGK